MFKPELWQSHDEYRTLVTTVGRRLSRNNPKYSFDIYEEEHQKLLNLNLDPLAEYIPGFYSEGGCTFALEYTQFYRRKSLVFPNFRKSDIRIRKYDYGSHYYAFVGDMQVRDGNKLKWNTYDEAYQRAAELVGRSTYFPYWTKVRILL